MTKKTKIEPNQPKHPMREPGPTKPKPDRKIPEKDKPSRPPVEIPPGPPIEVPIQEPIPDTKQIPKAGVL